MNAFAGWKHFWQLSLSCHLKGIFKGGDLDVAFLLQAQSTLVVRFCLNDSGLQMPDSGLAVFTTLLKAKLACSIRLPTSRNAPAFYARNR